METNVPDDVLELLEDDETFGEIVEEIRAKRAAAGLNPDTGSPANSSEGSL